MGETALKDAVTEQETGDARPTDEASSEREEEAPLAYRTFSPKIAPALTATGGVLALLGGLGTWLRATQVETEGLAAEQVAVTFGYDDPEGLTIATFGAVLVFASLLWVRRRPVFGFIPAGALKLVPMLLSLGIIGLVVWQLPVIDQEARDLAGQAIEELGFVSYHAGFGWGAWCLLVTAIAVFLGSAVGILREFDLRRAAKENREAAG